MDTVGDRGLISGLAEVVGAIGQDSFDARLAGLLAGAAAMEQVNLVCLERDQARCLFSWHRARPDMASHLIGQYVERRLYTRDLTLDRLMRPRHPGVRAEMLHCSQIEDDWYRRFFFEDVELGGKLAILDQSAAGAVYHNFYFSAGTDAFSPREADNLVQLSEILSQCVMRHAALTARPQSTRSRARPEEISPILANRAPGLTVREREVCSRIVTGYTTEAIALDLGIGTNSVATYRKRAYAKLGICSQHDLFLLCLDV